MMRKGKLIHLLVCIWILSLYFGVAQSSNLLASVRSIEDALSLITLPNNFLASFIRVVLDYKGIWLFVKVIGLIPVSSYLMLVISIFYYREYHRRLFLMIGLGPLLIFVANIVILLCAMSMMDVQSAINFAVFGTRISFVLSIVGALSTIVYWFTIESESVES